MLFRSSGQLFHLAASPKLVWQLLTTRITAPIKIPSSLSSTLDYVNLLNMDYFLIFFWILRRWEDVQYRLVVNPRLDRYLQSRETNVQISTQQFHALHFGIISYAVHLQFHNSPFQPSCIATIPPDKF